MVIHRRGNGERREVPVIGRSVPSVAGPCTAPTILRGARNGQGLRVGIFWSAVCGGGVETVNRDLAQWLPEAQYIVDGYVWSAHAPFTGAVAQAFDELIVLNERHESFSAQECFGPFTPVSQLAGFQRFLLERRYDVFLMSCCWGPFWLAHMHRIPIIEWWHGYGCWNGWNMPSDAIVAVSETTLRQIEVVRPHHAPATVIRNTVDTARFARVSRRRVEARQRLGLDPEAPVVLYCGRYSAEKRPEDAMRAFVRARQAIPELQFLMVGICLDEEYLRRQGTQIGLRWGLDSVHVSLSQDDIELAYAAADMLLHPSEWEGLGMVLLEAMAAGVPIISTMAGGCREVLQDGAIAVAVGDTAAMSEAIVSLASDARLRERLVQRAHHLVTTNGTPRDNASRLEAVIAGVLQARPERLTLEDMRGQELRARALAQQPLPETWTTGRLT